MTYKISSDTYSDGIESAMYVQTWKSSSDTVQIDWYLTSVVCREYEGSPESGIVVPTTPGNIIDLQAEYRSDTILVKWNDSGDYLPSYIWETDPEEQEQLTDIQNQVMALVCKRQPGGIASGMVGLGFRKVSERAYFDGTNTEVEAMGEVDEELARILEIARHRR